MSALNGVIQIAIPARDIDRATAFYCENLGLGLLMKGQICRSWSVEE